MEYYLGFGKNVYQTEIAYMVKLNSDKIAFRKIDNEYFVLTIDDAAMHNIVGSGVFILDQIVNEVNEEHILKALLDEFEISDDEAKSDLRKFLSELETLGITVNK